MNSVQIEPLYSLQEMRTAVEIQKIYWGNDIESVVPAHMLFSIVNTGGHVLAAIDNGRVVGVLIGLIGIDLHNQKESHELTIASKRMVVLPEYRSQGIGQRLKLAQREVCIKQGIRLVSWTFDPLLATNANLNLHKLGGISKTYLSNYYGTDDSTGLATLGYSDRLLVEWWVTSLHVEKQAAGLTEPTELGHFLSDELTLINPSILSEDFPFPGRLAHDLSNEVHLLEIPLNYPVIVQNNPDVAIAWREQTRQVFQDLMQRGYTLIDFIRSSHEGRDRAFYVLKQSLSNEYYPA